MSTTGREYGWDDTIEKDSEFVLLPKGDYDFEITALERGRYAGGDKLPPCNKATVSVLLKAPDLPEVTIKKDLFLHSSVEGILCAFFSAIGFRQKGEKIAMNWNKVVGATGRCHVDIRKWVSEKGNEIESNEIKKWYEKAAKEFKEGDF